jgi:hypothetical protein
MENTQNTYQDSNKSHFTCHQDRQAAHYAELQVELANSDGCVETTVLFDLEGNWTPAKLVDNRYGTSWLVLDMNGRSTGVFVPYQPKKRETQAKRGYVEGRARVTAVVKFSGFDSANICPALPLGTDRPIVIVSTDRFNTKAGN